MIADLIIKIVCKLFDRAMKEHDQEQIRLHEHRIMLTNWLLVGLKEMLRYRLKIWGNGLIRLTV